MFNKSSVFLDKLSDYQIFFRSIRSMKLE